MDEKMNNCPPNIVKSLLVVQAYIVKDIVIKSVIEAA